ncbi:hypothetical protein BMS3Bbin02_01805 [bacterium BMS3Bbin02]|nr:hypothetical protein BMS3Bbin02_01805 [bacterium BMS3Bbin02]
MVCYGRSHAGRSRTARRQEVTACHVSVSKKRRIHRSRLGGRAHEEGNTHFLGRHPAVVSDQTIVGVAVQE